MRTSTDRMRMHLCWMKYPGPHHYGVPLKDIMELVVRRAAARSRDRHRGGQSTSCPRRGGVAITWRKFEAFAEGARRATKHARQARQLVHTSIPGGRCRWYTSRGSPAAL